MQKPKHHLLVCSSFRVNGTPQGACHKKNATSLLSYLQNELADRGMDEITVSSTGCLNQCENGPVMVVYPEGTWYGKIDEAAIDEILDALEQGKKAETHVLA